MKKSIYLILLFLLFAGYASGANRTIIVVIKSKNIAPYNQAIEGFEEYLKGKGINPWLVPYDIEGDDRKAVEIIDEVRQKKPDLILTLGTTATEAAAARIRNIPIVFTVVLNPAGNLRSHENMTGVAMDIPPIAQFEVVKSILPGAKRIGVLYNPVETGQVVENARDAAVRVGMTLIAVSVASGKEVPQKLEELSKKVDLLYMIADSTVYTPKSTEFILIHSLKNGIPFIGLSEKYVKAGALLALSWDYNDLGTQAGELAYKIIQNARPDELSIAYPRNIPLILNLRTARNIGIKIPSTIIRKAEKVYE
ncbi:MAG: ABC transporter substrate-binding protein [Nitrospirae bacterium]|nr:ABC transporter substrate-binding protein [Nitrospirota bacterium]